MSFAAAFPATNEPAEADLHHACAQRSSADAAELEQRAGPRVAARWIDSFKQQILQLQDTPRIGQADEGLGGRRRLVAAPYLIVYEASGEEVRIIRVIHGARDLPRLFADEDD